MNRTLPELFCWTRFGTEAGEAIDAIVERKEKERRETGGIFLWGIGNSVAPAILELLRQAPRPEVLFSPIKGAPRQVDVSPAKLFEYKTAVAMDGRRVSLPTTIHVRGGSSGAKLNARYALVCRSGEPLNLGDHGHMPFTSMRNLVSGARLGASQVTAVVRREFDAAAGPTYVVAMRAELCEPYFVRLSDPAPVGEAGEAEAATSWAPAGQPILWPDLFTIV